MRVTKPSSGSFVVSIPAAMLQTLEPRTIEDFAGFSLSTIGTCAPNARERKFVISRAAKKAAGWVYHARGATTTSVFCGVKFTAAANATSAIFI